MVAQSVLEAGTIEKRSHACVTVAFLGRRRWWWLPLVPRGATRGGLVDVSWGQAREPLSLRACKYPCLDGCGPSGGSGEKPCMCDSGVPWPVAVTATAAGTGGATQRAGRSGVC